MLDAPVGEGHIVFSPAIKLRCPWVFGGGTAMPGVLVAITDDLRMVQIYLARGGNRYESSTEVDGLVLQLLLLVLNGRRWIGRVVVRRWWMLVVGYRERMLRGWQRLWR